MKHVRIYERTDSQITNYLSAKFNAKNVTLRNKYGEIEVIDLKYNFLNKKTTLELIEYFGENNFEITPIDGNTNFYVFNLTKEFLERLFLEIDSIKYNI